MTVDEARANSIASSAAATVQRRLGGPAMDFDVRVAPASVAPDGDVLAHIVTAIYAPGSSSDTDISDRVCDIVVFDRPSMTGSFLKSQVAHEIFHCWHHYNAASTTAAAPSAANRG